MTIPTPNLSERDARMLSGQIVERLRALGGRPQEFGVHLTRDGFSFTALLNGRMVTHRTAGEGAFTYEAVARELLALSLDPHDWGSRVFRTEAPTPPASGAGVRHGEEAP